jgi:hypothetical protein
MADFQLCRRPIATGSSCGGDSGGMMHIALNWILVVKHEPVKHLKSSISAWTWLGTKVSPRFTPGH